MKKIIALSILSLFALSANAQLGVPSSYKDTVTVGDSAKMIWQIGPPWVPAKLRSQNFANLATEIGTIVSTGVVTVTGTPPIVSSGGTNPAISISKGGTGTSGCIFYDSASAKLGCKAPTGTGAPMLQVSPTTTGTLTAGVINASGQITSNGNTIKVNNTNSTVGQTARMYQTVNSSNWGQNGSIMQTVLDNDTTGQNHVSFNLFKGSDGSNNDQLTISGETGLATFSGQITSNGNTIKVNNTNSTVNQTARMYQTVNSANWGQNGSIMQTVLDNATTGANHVSFNLFKGSDGSNNDRLTISGETGLATFTDTVIAVKDRAVRGEFTTNLEVGGGNPNNPAISTAKIIASGNGAASQIYSLGYAAAGVIGGGRANGSLSSPTASTNGQIGLALQCSGDTGSGLNKWQSTNVLTSAYLGTQSPTNLGKSLILSTVDSMSTASRTYARFANGYANWLGATDDGVNKFHTKSNAKVDSNLTVGGTTTLSTSLTGCMTATAGVVSATGTCGGFTGSGTSGKVPRFTGSTALGNSSISDDGTDATAGRDFTVTRNLAASALSINGGAAVIDNTGLLTANAVTTGGTATAGILKSSSLSFAKVLSASSVGVVQSAPTVGGNDTIPLKDYVDGGVYSIPNPSTDTQIDTIPDYLTIGSYVSLIGGVSSEIILPSVTEWPAGKPLSVTVSDLSGGSLLVRCSDVSCTISDDRTGTDTYTLPSNTAFVIPAVFTITSRVYGITLVHAAGSPAWQIISTATRSF